ncbi:hypothetical protein PHMEG_00024784 [Phytophthora megakarya]|uniref:Integrase catalytic domain-containing protein n=1 Tax=Phytophthora megakarya TaxID=4795 RepID=A0A225VCR9_9STRA|nr:hypothetical protein PHMEG_00024784 [Phytophthora megakarya]
MQLTITPAYSPWVNGPIVRINRDILQVIRAMTPEFRIGDKDWVYLVPLVQSSLNHTVVPLLGSHSPLELFTGLENSTPLSEFYLSDERRLQTVPASAELLNKKRERGENVVNVTVGDYVLRSRVDEKHGNKLQVMWVGPYQVTRADANSFRVKHLVTGDEQDVHASRLKFYSDDSLDVTDERLEHVSSQGIVLAVGKLKDHKWNNDINDFEILIGWKGLQPIEDSFEPMSDLAKEIRVLVGNYVTSTDDQRLHERWQELQRGHSDAQVHEKNQQALETHGLASLDGNENAGQLADACRGATEPLRKSFQPARNQRWGRQWTRMVSCTRVPRSKNFHLFEVANYELKRELGCLHVFGHAVQVAVRTGVRAVSCSVITTATEIVRAGAGGVHPDASTAQWLEDMGWKSGGVSDA